ncbi:MAG: hypothetical protein KDD04_00125 [Sinomicrobium sp.]|nr:hypothetical protein [Sinomicrobium sp.]
MKTIDRIAYLFLIIVFGIGLYFGFTDVAYFDTVITVEDGPVEYGTAIALLTVSLLCFYRLIKLWRFNAVMWRIGLLAFALLFFFGAGEEISWGQRIFNIDPGNFFRENNAQGETNLHNLVVGGKKVNKIVFSQLLMIVMVLYLLIAPVLYRKINRVKALADSFAIPVVKWHHTIAFLCVTALVVILPSERKWELYELAFGILFFLIFLYPLNHIIYKK